ncbi:squalene/phytoene synthase family protein [Sphingomonas hylomeconis]|uniref:Squalene/phytoene synthase family protein n=1 Tax=Sphingomonas hylomeconis TaxID=1395958 RepID=A0ABV7STF9_9SPHN|nr:squalene/phytoene synthase family protein [Sphingomonas hylomeconis]
MVNAPIGIGARGAAADPERALALSYARADVRAGVAALFALDDLLGRILRTTREPMIGQMRLTWWHEALGKLDAEDAPAEPVLQALARHVLPRGVSGTRLAGMIDAWEVLLDGEAPDAGVLDAFAQRGVILFGAAGTVLGAVPGDPVAPAGRGWALADLARHVSDAAVAARARGLAAAPLEAATAVRWSRGARTLGALAHLARLDLAAPAGAPIRPAAPARVWRLLRHRLTGR